jgi:Carboxypeptidase regulatory-like domain
VLGASVVVQNLQTGVKRSTETNHAGLYRSPVLTPGSYSIAASLKGFRDVRALVRVPVGNSTSLDMKLQWEPTQTRLR